MIVTDVKISLIHEPGNDKLLAFAQIVLDRQLLVRDIRVVRGQDGRPFICMPSKKNTDRCPTCGTKCHFRQKFCGGCGNGLDDKRNNCPSCYRGEVALKAVGAGGTDSVYCPNCAGSGQVKSLHSDVAHPVSREFRDELTRKILAVFWEETARDQKSLAG